MTASYYMRNDLVLFPEMTRIFPQSTLAFDSRHDSRMAAPLQVGEIPVNGSATVRLMEVDDGLFLSNSLRDEVLIWNHLNDGLCGNPVGNRKRQSAERDEDREPLLVADAGQRDHSSFRSQRGPGPKKPGTEVLLGRIRLVTKGLGLTLRGRGRNYLDVLAETLANVRFLRCK
jgi:hypothetical protein